ncbi:MAG: branched-chain amino acid aminotransferase [Henriciella sp.]
MIKQSYSDRDGVIWLDGHFVPWREAQEHILNQGLHYASSVFEGERAYEGRIFRSGDHTKRLLHSARRLGMDVDFTFEQIEAAKVETLERSGLDAAYIRPVIWRGSQQMGISVNHADIRFGIAAWHWGSYFSDKSKGIKLTDSPWARPPANCAPVDAKAAGLYMICTLAKKRAEEAGYSDALMLDHQGNIAEATGANIFFFRDGIWHTPAPTCFLNGITRQTVIEILRQDGIEIVERLISVGELNEFSQCFITGTAAEVTPVSEIMGHSFQVGQEAMSIVDRYDQAVRATDTRFSDAMVQGEQGVPIG